DPADGRLLHEAPPLDLKPHHPKGLSSRPNPLGLHRVSVLAVEDCRLRVQPLEAVDGTPLVDIKPVIRPTEG
ncbi:TrmO family methyltransferase domain-containing protein, partial [Segeticoccus rhizosphaerae]|uniref:TrmO family methyltransferase domain-containing protein n=1 Tax=Segeticoccus rhizosphaerae TaxID=1104777 RepID=UPI001EE3D4E1